MMDDGFMNFPHFFFLISWGEMGNPVGYNHIIRRLFRFPVLFLNI